MKPRTVPFTPLVASLWLTHGIAEQSVVAETFQVEVVETAGIRRFGYPISLKLPTLSSGPASARLRDGDKAVACQFRQEHNDGRPEAFWLDFNLSLMPKEARTLTLECGADVAADPEPRGLELKQMPEGFEIRNGPHLTWTLGRDMLTLLKSVDAGGLQYLRADGVRLDIVGPNEVLYKIGDETTFPRVLRSGPLAVAIRYESSARTGALAGMKSTVDLTFNHNVFEGMRMRAPIATGEMLYTKYQFRDLMAAGAADIIQPDLLLCGGLLEAKKIAAMAEANYVTVAPHNPLGPVSTAVAAQFAVSTPNFCILEYRIDSQGPARDLVLEPLKFADGYLEPPDAPGLGMELNEKAFERHPMQTWHRPFIIERDGNIGFQ